MAVKEFTEEVKKLIAHYQLHDYLSPNNISVSTARGKLILHLKLLNNEPVSIIMTIKTGSLSIHLFGVFEMFIAEDGEYLDDSMQLVVSFLKDAHSSNKKDYHLFLFKYYISIIKFFDISKIYVLPEIDRLALKNDISGLMTKMDGLYLTKQYKEIMVENIKLL